MSCAAPPDFSSMTPDALDEFRDQQNAIVMRWKPATIVLGAAVVDLVAIAMHVSIPLPAALIVGLAVHTVWAQHNFRNLTALDNYKSRNIGLTLG